MKKKPRDQRSCSITGRHRIRKKEADPANPSILRARCLDCGHDVVRSLITRRWVISAYLGEEREERRLAGEGAARVLNP